MEGIQNALLVGGQKRCWEQIKKYLAMCRVQIRAHWYEDKDIRKTIPHDVDIVIIISTQVSHELQNRVKSQASERGVPIAFTSHNFAKLDEALKKWGIVPVPVEAQTPESQVAALVEEDDPEPLVPIEEVLAEAQAPATAIPLNPPAVTVEVPPVGPVVQSVPTPERANEEPKPSEPDTVVEAKKEHPMPKRKAKQPHPTEVRAAEKVEYLKELLKADPGAPYEELNAKIISKFPGKSAARPGGLSKAEVTQIRRQEHGLVYGPGGRIFDLKGNRKAELERNRDKNGSKKETKPSKTELRARHVQRAQEDGHARFRAEARQEAAIGQSNDRLKQLVSELRHLMPSSNLASITIPLDGPIRVRESVEREFAL